MEIDGREEVKAHFDNPMFIRSEFSPRIIQMAFPDREEGGRG